MKYSEELLKLVKEKNLKNFWQCIEFLTIAGYPMLESFGVALKEFGASRIFENVAFARIEQSRPRNLGPTGRIEVLRQRSIRIGIIDDTNVHLSSLYSTYRNWLYKNKDNLYSEIEKTCEVIGFDGLNYFILDYLIEQSKLYYGFEAFTYSRQEDDKLIDLQGIPANLHRESPVLEDYLRVMRTAINPDEFYRR